MVHTKGYSFHLHRFIAVTCRCFISDLQCIKVGYTLDKFVRPGKPMIKPFRKKVTMRGRYNVSLGSVESFIESFYRRVCVHFLSLSSLSYQDNVQLNCLVALQCVNKHVPLCVCVPSKQFIHTDKTFFKDFHYVCFPDMTSAYTRTNPVELLVRHPFIGLSICICKLQHML